MYHLQSVITVFMVQTAFIIAPVHAMVVTPLMECAITDASPVGKELIAAKVSIHIFALICKHVPPFSFSERVFHSYVDVTITDDRLQSQIYVRHS